MKPSANRQQRPMQLLVVAAVVILCLQFVSLRAQHATPTIAPQIPHADRSAGNRVFLEHAERLFKQPQDSFMILVGDVCFSKGPMLMFCDSCHFYEGTESLDAFGNVHMEQGDTLFVFADELNYYGDREVAYLYGEPVRMINRNVELRTNEFIYDMANEVGYYEVGGTLTDEQNRLRSIIGEYHPNTKDSNFYHNVRLNSVDRGDTLNIYTDTLFYNTETHAARLQSESRIVNAQGVIYTSLGTYNTETEQADLYNRSRIVMNRGTTLTGDTLFYDRRAGYGEAFGNMTIVDSIRQSTLAGNYGYYNELTDSAFVTGRACAMEYSRGDTLYMHGRNIEAFLRIDSIKSTSADFVPDTLGVDTVTGRPMLSVAPEIMIADTTHVVVCYPRVRFFRSDMQGICDSLRFEERDSLVTMHRHPIVWSADRQIFGNVIQLHLNDSTFDRANLPDQAFTAQHVEEELYNQLAGKEMIAYFEDSELRRLDVNGNVQAIMLPEESDSTINKIVSAESSFLTATFRDRNIERMKMWPETAGSVTPLYLAKKSIFYLPRFKWYDGVRPLSPDDIFIIPEEMDLLMQADE